MPLIFSIHIEDGPFVFVWAGGKTLLEIDNHLEFGRIERLIAVQYPNPKNADSDSGDGNCAYAQLPDCGLREVGYATDNRRVDGKIERIRRLPSLADAISHFHEDLVNLEEALVFRVVFLFAYHDDILFSPAAKPHR